MVSLLTLIWQKIIPGAKKSLWIKMRKNNGAWVDFLLASKEMKFKADGMTYDLGGRPDIDNFTNQRVYHFLQGVSRPIEFDATHPVLIAVNRELGNTDISHSAIKQAAYAEADLVKSKKGLTPEIITLILVGFVAVVHTLILMMIMDKLGIKLM